MYPSIILGLTTLLVVLTNAQSHCSQLDPCNPNPCSRSQKCIPGQDCGHYCMDIIQK